jgi:hypothetical protein
MGVSIHYTGELTAPSVLPALIQEMQALSDEANWSATKIGPDLFHLPNRPPMQAEGLLVTIHPEIEPLNLVFNQEGRLVSFLFLIANAVEPGKLNEAKAEEKFEVIVVDSDGHESKIHEGNSKYFQYGLWHASTKTQFAGPAAHITLCKLLRYLRSKYFKRLDVNDEGGYWETGEVEQLIERMNIINFAIDRFSELLQSQTGESNSGERTTESLLADLRRFWQSIQKELPHKRR